MNGRSPVEILHEHLREVAGAGQVTRYSLVAPLVGLAMAREEDRAQMTEFLEEISRSEHSVGRPLLSAVVINVTDNVPGNNFFALATDLGVFDGGERFTFFIEELRRVHTIIGAHNRKKS